MHKPMMVLAAALLLTASTCPMDEEEDGDEEPCVGFCGTWSGGESSGAQNSGTIKFVVTGTTLAGDVAPISGSVRELVGTVSSNGAITASLAKGNTNGCAVNLSGQITSNQDGSQSASGTYALVASSTCATNNGTWNATKAAPTGS